MTTPAAHAHDVPGRDDGLDCERSFALLNQWQRDFPLVAEPFAEIARAIELAPGEVIDRYRRLLESGALSRIGGVFSASSGGAALLAAMAVPVPRIEEVAAIVSDHPGVNHNYEREHRYNLWFVMTGRDAQAVECAMAGLESATGLPALRLRLVRPYRIDLGFDLRRATAMLPPAQHVDLAPEKGLVPPGVCASEGAFVPPGAFAPAAVRPADLGLAALVEDGLPLAGRPYDVWADALGRPLRQVLETLRDWQRGGVLRRFGTIVRHHELGFAANAMTVFDVPDAQVDICGRALARDPAVTLAYQRSRAQGWNYNLYCMVHGRDRETVREVLRRAIADCGLDRYPHAVLFSTRRFKQTGARRFRELPGHGATAQGQAHAGA